MTAPALPEDVVDQIASILKREYGWELDPRVKVDARVLAEIRAAIAAHVAPGGEPVAVPTVTWDEKHGALCVRFVPPGTHAMRTYIAHNNPFVAVDYGAGGTIHSVEVLAPATRPAATGDTGEGEKAARTAALYVDEAWRKGAPKSAWHPIKATLMRDAIRAATGGPDAR